MCEDSAVTDNSIESKNSDIQLDADENKEENNNQRGF